jgi:hypothetical protein
MSQNNSDRAPPGGRTIQLPTSLTSDAGDGVADALDLLYRTTRNWRFGYLADFERRVPEGSAGPRALPDDGSLREMEELIKTGQERGPTAAARRVVRKSAGLAAVRSDQSRQHQTRSISKYLSSRVRHPVPAPEMAGLCRRRERWLRAGDLQRVARLSSPRRYLCGAKARFDAELRPGFTRRRANDRVLAEKIRGEGGFLETASGSYSLN